METINLTNAMGITKMTVLAQDGKPMCFETKAAAMLVAATIEGAKVSKSVFRLGCAKPPYLVRVYAK